MINVVILPSIVWVKFFKKRYIFKQVRKLCKKFDYCPSALKPKVWKVDCQFVIISVFEKKSNEIQFKLTEFALNRVKRYWRLPLKQGGLSTFIKSIFLFLVVTISISRKKIIFPSCVTVRAINMSLSHEASPTQPSK